MSSAAQTIANRANAQLSTGPRTLEGKARVSQNAISHGLTAKHLVIRDDEREEFAVFQDSLVADLDPQGALETITFHELLHAAWTLARLRRIEAEVSTGKVKDFIESETIAILDRLGRYQARAQRAYYRALQELRALQTSRALRAVKLDRPSRRRPARGRYPRIDQTNPIRCQRQGPPTRRKDGGVRNWRNSPGIATQSPGCRPAIRRAARTRSPPRLTAASNAPQAMSWIGFTNHREPIGIAEPPYACGARPKVSWSRNYC